MASLQFFTGVAVRKRVLSEDEEITEDDQVADEQSQVRVLKKRRDENEW